MISGWNNWPARLGLDVGQPVCDWRRQSRAAPLPIISGAPTTLYITGDVRVQYTTLQPERLLTTVQRLAIATRETMYVGAGILTSHYDHSGHIQVVAIALRSKRSHLCPGTCHRTTITEITFMSRYFPSHYDRREHIYVQISCHSTTFTDITFICDYVTSEPPPMVRKAGCLQGQDHSAVTHPSSSHAGRCLTLLSCDNHRIRYTTLARDSFKQMNGTQQRPLLAGLYLPVELTTGHTKNRCLVYCGRCLLELVGFVPYVLNVLASLNIRACRPLPALTGGTGWFRTGLPFFRGDIA
ncbi:hypothetical protein J6590_029392 [Homalodisca vitripennis]|nr:hypothetical protein J6590_029392 [Homalodisca vitripennis]